MCKFNTGCPGEQTPEGFADCENPKNCASGIADDPDYDFSRIDICNYCGCNQGPVLVATGYGQLRNGHDCFNCGSN